MSVLQRLANAASLARFQEEQAEAADASPREHESKWVIATARVSSRLATHELAAAKRLVRLWVDATGRGAGLTDGGGATSFRDGAGVLWLGCQAKTLHQAAAMHRLRELRAYVQADHRAGILCALLIEPIASGETLRRCQTVIGKSSRDVAETLVARAVRSAAKYFDLEPVGTLDQTRQSGHQIR
jgi:hypothetical protein